MELVMVLGWCWVGVSDGVGVELVMLLGWS